MTTLNRRHFLSAGALGAAGLAVNVHAAPEDKTDMKKPLFKCGLVTYNLAAAWDLDKLLDVCKATGGEGEIREIEGQHGSQISAGRLTLLSADCFGSGATVGSSWMVSAPGSGGTTGAAGGARSAACRVIKAAPAHNTATAPMIARALLRWVMLSTSKDPC